MFQRVQPVPGERAPAEGRPLAQARQVLLQVEGEILRDHVNTFEVFRIRLRINTFVEGESKSSIYVMNVIHYTQQLHCIIHLHVILLIICVADRDIGGDGGTAARQEGLPHPLHQLQAGRPHHAPQHLRHRQVVLIDQGWFSSPLCGRRLDTFIMSASGAGGERRGARAAGHQGVLVRAAGRARGGQLAARQAVPR